MLSYVPATVVGSIDVVLGIAIKTDLWRRNLEAVSRSSYNSDSNAHAKDEPTS